MLQLEKYLENLAVTFEEFALELISAKQLSDELNKFVLIEGGVEGYIPADYEDEEPLFKVYFRETDEAVTFSREGIAYEQFFNRREVYKLYPSSRKSVFNS